MNSLAFIEPNRRILVVDDNRAIHEDLQKILCPTRDRANDLRDDEALLFGTVPALTTEFQIDSAFQGVEGLEKVKAALSAGRPYAMAFVDIRMPPGWDGVETVSQLRGIDPNLQTVIFTAYSDYSWTDIQRRLGHSDSLLILKKPFDNMEVMQLAHGLTRRWLSSRQAEARVADLDLALARRTAELALADAQYRSVAEIAPDGIITRDSECETGSVDGAVGLVRGYPAVEWTRGQSPATVLLRKDRELFLIALRVLSHIVEDSEPSRRDVIMLRHNAVGLDAELPADELCFRFIRRELGSHQTVLELAGQALQLVQRCESRRNTAGSRKLA